jgi:hypothetical protein
MRFPLLAMVGCHACTELTRMAFDAGLDRVAVDDVARDTHDTGANGDRVPPTLPRLDASNCSRGRVPDLARSSMASNGTSFATQNCLRAVLHAWCVALPGE